MSDELQELFKRANLVVNQSVPNEVIAKNEISPLFYSAQEFEESGAIEFILEKMKEANNTHYKVKEVLDMINIYKEISEREDLTLDLYLKQSVVTGTIYGTWLRYQMMYTWYNQELN